MGPDGESADAERRHDPPEFKGHGVTLGKHRKKSPQALRKARGFPQIVF